MANIIQTQDARRVFIETLIELREKDNKVILILCDTGFNYVESFQKKFPESIKNFGVTEQSTVMISVGLALSGFKPYFYSMIPFVLFRPYEMIRNGVVKHNANVKILGVQGGPSYKMLGFSHNLSHDEEDTNLCDNIGLQWHKPALKQVRDTILKTYKENHPAYIRL